MTTASTITENTLFQYCLEGRRDLLIPLILSKEDCAFLGARNADGVSLVKLMVDKAMISLLDIVMSPFGQNCSISWNKDQTLITELFEGDSIQLLLARLPHLEHLKIEKSTIFAYYDNLDLYALLGLCDRFGYVLNETNDNGVSLRELMIQDNMISEEVADILGHQANIYT